MINNRISWVWMMLLFLCFAFYNLSAFQARPISSHHPTAVVVGSVYCDVCHKQDLSKASHFISGAIAAVECANSGKRKRFYQEVTTNMRGEFSIHLPFLVDKHVKHIMGCSARLISSSKPHCAVASTEASSSSFRLQSRKKGTHIFSAGFFTFKPVYQPKLCNQKPSIHSTNKKEAYPDKSLTSTPNDPIFYPSMSSFITINQGFLPPLPGLPPLPQLPPLPPIIVLPPIFHSPPTSPPSIFPPTFHLPPMAPPSISPPILSPPIFGSTPPYVPGLTPLRPTSPFHLPPFPFRPMRGFPGAPHSSASSPNKNSP
ncbi:pollen-specific leucine-rich repeat extensin-like protein 4 [Capsicum galapagoense]